MFHLNDIMDFAVVVLNGRIDFEAPLEIFPAVKHQNFLFYL